MLKKYLDARLIIKVMSYTVTRESFNNLTSCWRDANNRLRWGSIFVLPPWLKAWWQQFGVDAELFLSAVRKGEEVIGVAPLMVRGNQASFIGSEDVCDYLDFVVSPGSEDDFFNFILDDLIKNGINNLDLKLVRHDSTVLGNLAGIAQRRGYQVSCSHEDVSLELDLPTTWEAYLEMLNAKQRHEVRRKLRRLGEMGEVDYHVIRGAGAVNDAMDDFLRMFSESREDKFAFLTAPIESFFRSVVNAMGQAGLLRMGILKLGDLPTAMVMCFDYNSCLYLYNSGYDRQYNYLSAGLLSKVLCLKNSLEEGRKSFNFLKGDEPYKYRLGGREVPLSRCQITIE